MTRPSLADLPDVLDPSTAADYLAMGENTVYRALSRGDLPGVKVGGRWLIARDALARHIGIAPPSSDDADTVDVLSTSNPQEVHPRGQPGGG